MFEQMMKWWCRNFHSEIFRPVNGEYRCAVCLRTFPVEWQVNPVKSTALRTVHQNESRPEGAVLPLPARV